MGGIISFVTANYIWFIIICVILIFALIGYIVDAKTSEPVIKEHKEVKKEELPTVEIKEELKDKTLKEATIKKEEQKSDPVPVGINENVEYDKPLIIDDIEEKK